MSEDTHPAASARLWLIATKNFWMGLRLAALRILSEYLEPLSHFQQERIKDTIVFFGSARSKKMVRWATTIATRGTGALLTAWAKTSPASHLPLS